MAKPQVKAQAIELRITGLTYNEIVAKLGVSRGSLSLWLRSVQPSHTGALRLKAKLEKAEEARINALDRSRPPREVRIAALLAAKRSTKAGRMAAGLTFTKLEAKAKPILEKYFGVQFHKEQIGNKFCDFCSTSTIVEYTIAKQCGLYRAITRLAAIADERNKYIVCYPHLLGSRYLGIVEACNITVVPITKLPKLLEI